MDDNVEVVAPAASRLGSREHWDAVYAREIRVFEETRDVGEIWFGEDCEHKMIQWIERKYVQAQHADDVSRLRVLELGCGNGHLLLGLMEYGFAELVGVDYSPAAVDLAISVARDHLKLNDGNDAANEDGEDGEAGDDDTGVEHSKDEKESEETQINKDEAHTKHEDIALLKEAHLSFAVADILLPPPASLVPPLFDLVLDKGTFDAISLSTNDNDKSKYAASVSKWMSPSSIFLITSCNWTRSELEHWMKPYFVFKDEVKHKQFQFGGVQGQSVTTLAFSLANHV